MSVLLLDSHTTHAAVVKLILGLGAFDLVYCSDTRLAPFDELSGLTRVSRLLTLLGTHARGGVSTAVLLGRGMSDPPREALEVGARRAGIELIHAADLLADHACSVLRPPGGLCLVGDSCLTEAVLRAPLGRSDRYEVRWCRIAPLYMLDEPLRPILKSWGKAVGAYVVATPENARVASQITRDDPGAEIVDEYEHLALTLAERLPGSASRRLRTYVTERTDALVARLASRLGVTGNDVLEMGAMEPSPTSGPFALSLDADGAPA